MLKTLLGAFVDGFADALHLFAALVMAPVSVLRAFVSQDAGKRAARMAGKPVAVATGLRRTR